MASRELPASRDGLLRDRQVPSHGQVALFVLARKVRTLLWRTYAGRAL